jgi:hypothetical protein
MKKVSYRAYLEVRGDDGKLVFMPTRMILASPKLQAQCTEIGEPAANPKKTRQRRN